MNEEELEVDEEQEEQPEEELDEEILSQQERKKQEQILKQKRKKMKIKLIAMARKISSTRAIALTPEQQTTLKNAKKLKKLSKEILLVQAALTKNKTKLWMKTMSAAPPLLKFLLIGALCILILLVVGVVVSGVVGVLNNTYTSAFGITGEGFYGARMVYKDDELSSRMIVQDYVELVENGVNQTQEITSVDSVNVTLKVNITMPNEEYDYSTLEEEAFSAEYNELYNIVFDMAKIVYKADNNEDYTGTELLECVNGIMYFGYGEIAMGDIKNVVVEAILSKTTETSSAEVSADQIRTATEEKLNAVYSDEKYNLRAEKLFIKDYILEDDDSKVSGVSKEQYVAFIFMPKKELYYQKFSFMVTGDDLTGLSFGLRNNEEVIHIQKDDYNYSMEETGDSYMLMTRENLDIKAEKFQDIDEENLNALAEGLSLFDIINNSELDYNKFLETTTGENGNEFLTFKKNGVYMFFEHSQEFVVVEFETLWNASLLS